MANGKSFWSNFGLNHDQPWLFYGPKCGLPMSVYAVYRFLMAGYFVSICTWDLVFKAGRTTPQMTYMTMWSYMLQTVTMFIKMLITTSKAIGTKCKRPDETFRGVYPIKMTWILQFEWLCHTLATVIPITISVGYWIKPNIEVIKYRHETEPLYLHFTIQMHAVNGVLALVDFLMSAIPISLFHMYQPMLFQLYYFIFKYIYYAVTGGKPIYYGDDMTDLRANFFGLFVAMLEIGGIFVFMWLLSVLQAKCCCRPKQPMIDSHDFGVYTVKTPLLNAAVP